MLNYVSGRYFVVICHIFAHPRTMLNPHIALAFHFNTKELTVRVELIYVYGVLAGIMVI